MGRVLHAEGKHRRRKPAWHFCTSGIWCWWYNSSVLLPFCRSTASSEQPGLHFAPHQTKCSVIHLSDPVHQKHCSYWQDLLWQKACQQEPLLSLTPLATTEVSTKAIVLLSAVLAGILNAWFLENNNLFPLYAANSKGKFTNSIVRQSCSSRVNVLLAKQEKELNCNTKFKWVCFEREFSLIHF